MSLNPLSFNYLNSITNTKKLKIQKARTLPGTRMQTSHQQQQQIQQKPSIIYFRDGVQVPIGSGYLFYGRRGYLIGYERKKGMIEGVASFVFYDGTLFNCVIRNNKLQGWAAAYKKGRFALVCKYTHGYFSGQQFSYDLASGIMIKSLYKNGKLQVAEHGWAGSQSVFEKHISNQEALKTLKGIQQYSYFKQKWPEISTSSILYFGESLSSFPKGYGVVFAEKELFFGNFEDGLLEGEGSILFANGDSYVGQFEAGQMKGLGVYRHGNTQIYRENQIVLSESQYRRMQIRWGNQASELMKIFRPVFQIHGRLSLIELQKANSLESRAPSLVEVDIQNITDFNEQKSQHSIGNSSDKQSESKKSQKREKGLYITNLEAKIKSDRKQKGEKGLELNDLNDLPRFSNSKDQKNETFGIEDDEDQEKKDLQQNVQKQKRPNKMTLNDFEWRQVIGELAQNDVNQQYGFLMPQTASKQPAFGLGSTFGEKKQPENARFRNQLTMSQGGPGQEAKEIGLIKKLKKR